MTGIPQTRTRDIDLTHIEIGAVLTSTPLQVIAKGQAHVAGYVAQSCGCWQKEVSEQLSGAAASYGPLAFEPKGYLETDRIHYRVSNVAKYLQLHMQVQVAQRDASNKVEVWASLYGTTTSVDGSSSSPATEWANGFNLDSNIRTIDDTDIYLPTMISTGMNVVDPPSALDLGRCLNIEAARGAWITIYVRQTECRVLSCDIQELWDGVL